MVAGTSVDAERLALFQGTEAVGVAAASAVHEFLARLRLRVKEVERERGVAQAPVRHQAAGAGVPAVFAAAACLAEYCRKSGKTLKQH